MSEPNNSAWPFTEITESEGFDIDKIFGTGNGTAQADPFAAPAPVPASRCRTRTGSCCCPHCSGNDCYRGTRR